MITYKLMETQDMFIQLKRDNLGTGATVELVSNETGETVATYKIIIFGDVNGDGIIDANDAGIMEDHEKWRVTWDPLEDAAFLIAADINGDGNVDSIDADILVDVENYIMDICQTTGVVL
jgi:hypothetical protein